MSEDKRMLGAFSTLIGLWLIVCIVCSVVGHTWAPMLGVATVAVIIPATLGVVWLWDRGAN